MINANHSLKSFYSIKDNLESALSGINESINERKADIVIENGLGYRHKGFSKIFPHFNSTTHYEEEVSITIIENDKGEKHTFYYSKELDLLIVGEPEKREDGLYCKITGNRISE